MPYFNDMHTYVRLRNFTKRTILNCLYRLTSVFLLAEILVPVAVNFIAYRYIVFDKLLAIL